MTPTTEKQLIIVLTKLEKLIDILIEKAEANGRV